MAAKAELKAKLSLNSNPFMSGLKSAKGAAVSFAGAVGSVLKSALTSPIAAIGGLLAGAFSIGKFVEGIKGAIDLGGAMEDLKAQTGEAADKLLIFQEVIKANGVDAGEARGILNKLQKSVAAAAESGAVAYENFGQFGLSVKELIAMSPVDQFKAVSGAIQKIENPTLRAAAAMKIFGKSGGALLGALSDTQGFEDAAKSIGRQAAILKANSADFDAIGDRLGRAGLKLQGFFIGVTSKITPALLAATDAFDKADFAEAGERFGAGIETGVNALVGAFGNADLFTSALSNGLKGAAADFGNTIAAIFKSIPESIGIELEHMEEVFMGMLKTDKAKLLGDNAGVSDGVADVGDATLKYLQKMDALQAKLNGNPDDLFGAKAFFDEAKKAFEQLGKAGAKAIEDAITPAKKEVKKAFSDSTLSRSYTGGLRGASMSSGSPLGYLWSPGNTDPLYTALSRGAYNKSPLLNARERRGFEDSAVARGERRGSRGFGGYGAVRAGDAKRAKEFQKAEARKRDGVELTNQLLGGVAKDVADIKGNFQ